MIVAKFFALSPDFNFLYFFGPAIYPKGGLGWRKETRIDSELVKQWGKRLRTIGSLT
jgi:hypothetical protein